MAHCRMLKYSANELVRLLELERHPEGGYFRETYRSGCAPGNTGSVVVFSSPEFIIPIPVWLIERD